MLHNNKQLIYHFWAYQLRPLFCKFFLIEPQIDHLHVKLGYFKPTCILSLLKINFFSTKLMNLILVYPEIDRQPRRFIYPKDGGRFDAPKMHVFTHLLRKCFTGKSKVRLRPPKSTIYGGSKWPLFTPKTAWIKIA